MAVAAPPNQGIRRIVVLEIGAGVLAGGANARLCLRGLFRLFGLGAGGRLRGLDLFGLFDIRRANGFGRGTRGFGRGFGPRRLVVVGEGLDFSPRELIEPVISGAAESPIDGLPGVRSAATSPKPPIRRRTAAKLAASTTRRSSNIGKWPLSARETANHLHQIRAPTASLARVFGASPGTKPSATRLTIGSFGA